MTSTSAGYRFENVLVGGIDEATPLSVLPIPCGYSGNHVVPSPDILVVEDGRALAAIEVKKTSAETLRVDFEDFEQLAMLSYAVENVCLAVKFSNREMMVAMAHTDYLTTKLGKDGVGDPTAVRDHIIAETPMTFAPRTGRTGTYIVDDPWGSEDDGRPRREQWPSERAGRDPSVVIVEELGLTDGHSNEGQSEVAEA